MSEAKRIEALIRAAFEGVTREGGISWAQSVEEDLPGYGPARLPPGKDTAWTDLIDDPDWEFDRGTGGVNFLDPIGYRYYLAPAMIRALRGEHLDSLIFTLTVGSVRSFLRRHGLHDRPNEQWSLLTPTQLAAIKEFVGHMAAEEALSMPEGIHTWQRTWRRHWESLEV